MTSQKYFITGTDTGVGKTFVSVMLLRKYQEMGLKTVGLKPVASGCQVVAGKLRNDDALKLQHAATVEVDYDMVNPFAFEQPIAPHIAAKFCDQKLTVSGVSEKLNQAFTLGADMFIIEGVGGWLVPLNEKESVADIVKTLKIPTILVVGIKLGCLNHALLTAKAITDSGVELAGWFANCLDPDALMKDENIDMLKQKIEAPLLGVVPYNL